MSDRRGSKQHLPHLSPDTSHPQSSDAPDVDHDAQTCVMQGKNPNGLTQTTDEGYQTGPGDGYPTPPSSG